MHSYFKGIILSFVTTTIAVVPSLIFHGFTAATGLAIALGITILTTFVVWCNMWRYQWQPEIRNRWFYVNFTSPTVVFLSIQAIGWPVFHEQKNNFIVPIADMQSAHLVASLGALVAITLWIAFSLYHGRAKPGC